MKKLTDVLLHKVQVIFCEWANEYISTISVRNVYSQSFRCKGSWILTTPIETSKIQLNWIQEVGTTNLIQLHSLIAVKYLRITCASEYLNYFNKKGNLRQRFRNFMKITQFFIHQGANDIFFPHGKKWPDAGTKASKLGLSRGSNHKHLRLSWCFPICSF